MGLDDADLLDHGGAAGANSSAVPCSICLDEVTDNSDRSWAKLQCGHKFHLDCIGSAFNVKGAMQCPNCRKIEKGQWLYAGGHRAVPEFSIDDWAYDEDLFDQMYSEMSFGVHWCPFGGLTNYPYDEGEISSNTYHDFLGQHAIYAQSATSSATQPCPYVAYIGPIQPSSSNSSGNVMEGSNFGNHWNSPAVPSELPTSYAFQGMDTHYRNWEQHPSSFPATSNRISNVDRVPSATQTVARTSPDITRSGSFVQPLVVAHSNSSGARTGSSAAPRNSPYPSSVARAHGRVQALQAAYSQQPSVAPPMHVSASGTRRSSGPWTQTVPMASSTDRTGVVHFFPLGSSTRTFQEADNPLPGRMPAREHEHMPGWTPFHQLAGGSDTGGRSGNFRQRHGSERLPPHSRS